MTRGRTRRRGREGAIHGAISCFEARPLLSALLDGEADDLQRARADRHVRSCAQCRDFQQFSVRARALALESLPGGAGPSESHARTAARLAAVVKASGTARPRSDSWRSVVVGATLAAALSLGAVVGGLGVWTLSQTERESELVAEAPRALPRATIMRTLDPGTVTEEPVSILTAWAPDRPVENTFDEKSMFWATPMSHFERVHYLPEQL